MTDLATASAPAAADPAGRAPRRTVSAVLWPILGLAVAIGVWWTVTVALDMNVVVLPAPPEVLDGLVEVLKRWSTEWERPVAVVPMPSRRFPQLVESLAGHVARIGRLPLVEALEVTGPPPRQETASAVRASDLLARTRLRTGVSFDGPVLLIDDTVRTRWTVTVATALLAEAGATQVLPLVVHQLP